MGTASLAVLGALIVVLQSPTDAAVPPQDGLSRTDREMMEDEVPVLYLPKATIGLTRKKRQWIIPPINIPENNRGPFPKRVVQIQTDKQKVIYYSITGPGADQEPKNRFTIDRASGNLYVNQPLDREEISNYTFQVHAVADGGGTAENPLKIQVFVVDQNDNKPTFTQDTYMGQVAETSPIGFEFIQVTAIDDDEEGSLNADVRYSIMSQDPKSPTDEMFSINPVTGYIQVNALGLDREKNPKYTLEVQAADMEGEGLRGTTKVIITVTDGNDQDPVLVQSQSSPDAAVPPQDGLTRMKRETMKDEVPVLYFPKATNGLKRRKREWIIPPINLPENDKGPFPKKVVQIRSSSDREKVILYSITGPGADQPPKDLFRMDRATGNLYVTKPLDREETAVYNLQSHAVADGSGVVENPMEIQVFVIDMNDNKPKFTQDTYMGEVAESSPVGFEFLQVTATDADEEGNHNSDVRYSIMSQDPKSLPDEMFSINPVTGYIRVNALGLDREKIPKYTLEIRAADLVGEGLTGTAKVILTVTDGNDNAPVFVQSQYEATVAENQMDAFVVRMSVTDGDDPLTPAWNAKFTIIDGDQGGLFSVETAPNKQEGIITTAKGLDFETAATHTLLVTVENEVPFAVPLPTSTATVIVTVQDVNEPQFLISPLF